MQLAIPKFLEQRQGFQKQLIARVRQNLAELDHQLAGQKACSRLALEGGWYGVIRVPATCSSENLAIELMSAKGVFVHPGHFYDLPADGYLVLSFITPETNFSQAISGLLEFLV